ncbi:unnamed protein product [Lactuca virosa]|uniref:Uncharacterized protein n=1 Tax=Lactuca virosa TaxID=75947 RepID=A0AAU9LTC5_9ASTR|nr:unnamed protein product [Lactuca virosa]
MKTPQRGKFSERGILGIGGDEEMVKHSATVNNDFSEDEVDTASESEDDSYMQSYRHQTLSSFSSGH